MAIGLNSMPYWSSTGGVAVLATAMFVGGAAAQDQHRGQGRPGPVPDCHRDVGVLPVRHAGVRIAEVDDVDHELAELRQLLGGVHGEGRQDRFERLVGVADPLLADRLVGIVRDR